MKRMLKSFADIWLPVILIIATGVCMVTTVVEQSQQLDRIEALAEQAAKCKEDPNDAEKE